jgi:hypothetical protein
VTSIWTDCGSVVSKHEGSFDVASRSSGKTVRYDVRTARYVGALQSPQDLAAGVPVRIEAVRSEGRWQALTVARSECGQPASFSLGCDATPAAVVPVTTTPGESSSSHSCTVTSTGGFYGAVDLSCDDLPPGLSCSFDPNPVTPPPNGSRSTMLALEHVSAAAYQGGTYPVSVSGMSAGQMRQTVHLQIALPSAAAVQVVDPGAVVPGAGSQAPVQGTPARARGVAGGGAPAGGAPGSAKPAVEKPDFAVSCSPDVVTAATGGKGNGVCAVAFTGGFKLPVRLACSTPAPGLACAFNPDTVSPSSAASTVASSLSVGAGGSAVPGRYPLEVRASTAAASRVVGLSLNVSAPRSQSPDFSVTCASANLSSSRDMPKATTTCGVAPVAGFASPVTLSCEGMPPGLGCSFAATVVTPAPGSSATSRLDVTVSGTLPEGVYTFQVVGRAGGLARSVHMRLVVQP